MNRRRLQTDVRRRLLENVFYTGRKTIGVGARVARLGVPNLKFELFSRPTIDILNRPLVCRIVSVRLYAAALGALASRRWPANSDATSIRARLRGSRRVYSAQSSDRRRWEGRCPPETRNAKRRRCRALRPPREPPRKARRETLVALRLDGVQARANLRRELGLEKWSFCSHNKSNKMHTDFVG